MVQAQLRSDVGDISASPVIRVAVVEDTEEVRDGLAWLFGHSPGFECLGAYVDAEQALKTFALRCPDVVVMDIDLPGISGIEALKRIKQRWPQVQVSMLTVFEDEEKIFRSLQAGATGYLLKNTAPSGILEAVRDLHAGGSPMSSQVARKVLNSFVQHSLKPRASSMFARFSRTEPSPQSPLCEREQQILHLLAKGHRYKEIADDLGISIHTVRTFIRRMYEKLHVHSRTEALIKVRGQ